MFMLMLMIMIMPFSLSYIYSIFFNHFMRELTSHIKENSFYFFYNIPLITNIVH